MCIIVQSTQTASVSCTTEYINPLHLQDDTGGEQEGVDPTVGMGSGRRKRSSTVKRTLTKRQDNVAAKRELSDNVVLVSTATIG